MTPLDRCLASGRGPPGVSHGRARWYRRHGRPVTVVIPSYRDAELVAQLVAKIRQTTPRDRVRIIVTDDASGTEHIAALRAIEGSRSLPASTTAGFSANVNRGLRAADPAHDVVLLNSDVVPLRDWLACLQYAATRGSQVGIVGAKLLYPDNRIQYGGYGPQPRAPEWFDHRYRFKPADWGPANVAGPTLAATGACMYIQREVLDQVGLFDEAYPMGYEDVDYCLRAWQAGYEVLYAPSAQLHHHESLTRGTEVGDRERTSQRVFWERWAAFIDERRVLTADGQLRVVYVTEDTIVGGGHRVIFEHLNGLTDRGHDVRALDARACARTGLSCAARCGASPTTRSSRRRWRRSRRSRWRRGGTPPQPSGDRASSTGFRVYFVQDIETSYYRDAPEQPLRGAELLPPRVSLPDHLGLEPGAPARAGA